MTTSADVLIRAIETHQRGHLAEAERLYREILAADPSSAAAAGNLGALLQSQSRFEEAVECFERALAIDPAYAPAHCNLGSIYKDQGQHDRAIGCYRRAIELRPDMAEAHFNLGVILQGRRELAAAAESYRSAIAARPDYAQALSNLGTIYKLEGRLPDAAECYERAIAARPDFADAHRNRALLWLLEGDFERGWPEYESRLSASDVQQLSLAARRWQGEPLPGGTVLLLAEQGLGDTIQFIRYAALVKERSQAQVVVQCSASLHALLATAPGVDRLVDPQSSSGPLDACLPLMSLPAVFGTTQQTVPASVPYLSADKHRVERWRRALGDDGSLKVGIAWQGSPEYANDENRSVPLEYFRPLAQCDSVQVYSLQKGFGREQLAALGDSLPVIDLAPSLDEEGAAFVDTAAVMMNLDLVVTSDTSIAHLAGALGVEVFLALGSIPDWRWMLARSDSPWYPTMRLFRAIRGDGWNRVFAEIAQQLQSISAARAAKLK